MQKTAGLCERKMAPVPAAIKRGSFDYRAHFPRGSRLSVFYPKDYSHEGHTIGLDDYLESLAPEMFAHSS